MKTPKFTLILVTILLVTDCLVSQQSIHFQNISVIYNAGDSAAAQRIIGQATSARRELEKYFNLEFPDSILITLNNTKDQYLKQTGVPDWSGGSAIPSRKKIFINLEDLKSERQSFVLISHELAHLFIYVKTGAKPIPVWMNEGLAMLSSGEELAVRDHASLANAIANDKMLGFAKIDSLLHFPRAQARLAYIQSLIAVNFWIEQIGEENVNTFLDLVAKGNAPQFVFWQMAHMTFDDLEQKYRDKLEREYSWFFLLNFDSVLWSGLVLLFLVAVLIRYVKNRRRIRNWELEDRNNFEE